MESRESTEKVIIANWENAVKPFKGIIWASKEESENPEPNTKYIRLNG